MRIAAAAFATVSIGLLSIAFVGGTAEGHGRNEREGVRVSTAGRLRPGHLETIRVSGFPGKGETEVSFFPTAICESGCGARNLPGGSTNSDGSGKLVVRMPGTFFNSRERPTYFRDGERIEVMVTWEGPGRSFAVGNAEPEPILVRVHGGRHG